GALFPGGVNPYAQAAAALISGNQVCQSAPDPTGNVFTGSKLCATQSLDVDRSNLYNRQYSVEAHIDSHFTGMFNFLLGGLYLDGKTGDSSYYVNSFGLDYASALLGAANALGARAAGATVPNLYAGTPYYRNHTDDFRLKSYGIFGETYFQFSDRLKLTLGLRYNHDEKTVAARTTFASDTQSCQLRNSTRAAPSSNSANNCHFANETAPLLLDAEGKSITVSASNTVLNPFGTFSVDQAINAPILDFDPATAGPQRIAAARVSFGRLTGRAVLDFKLTPDNLIYFSYSRGYKSGGINPPLSPAFTVPSTFQPEKVNAFEIGSKNTFANGNVRLNLTAFYYEYSNLQLSRIVARTSVNDNIDAHILGVEAEALLRPSRNWLFNLSASFLRSKVSGDRFLANPQDPSGGRSDTVIIKDITNASNCAVRPVRGAVGTAAAAGFVDFVNTQVLGPAGVKPTQQIYADGTRGAFSSCSILAAVAAGNGAAYSPGLAALQPFANGLFNGGQPGALPFVVDSGGAPVNIRGNQLPQAPNFKFSAGLQYTAEIGDWTLVPRADLTYTGDYYGSIFNQNINRIQGFAVVNAQVQLNGPDDRWFVRAFVQNLTKNNAITGEYVTDQSSGNFTNVFTLEPRRYGIAAGFRF
ncbi:MAG TPA: TonB-dependent receptor, partial [Sphingomonas sp.]|nr:TonB-dependent receptor [Sphingomonas sp.]